MLLRLTKSMTIAAGCSLYPGPTVKWVEIYIFLWQLVVFLGILDFISSLYKESWYNLLDHSKSHHLSHFLSLLCLVLSLFHFQFSCQICPCLLFSAPYLIYLLPSSQELPVLISVSGKNFSILVMRTKLLTKQCIRFFFFLNDRLGNSTFTIQF